MFNDQAPNLIDFFCTKTERVGQFNWFQPEFNDAFIPFNMNMLRFASFITQQFLI